MTYYFAPHPYRMPRRWAHAAYSTPEDFCLTVNVREEDNEFIINALVPGLKAEDLNIQILDDKITIEGEFKSDDSEYLLRELPYGSFRRTLHLSAPMDAEKAEAKIEGGVLTLHLPKAESARPKTIKVNVK